MENKCFFCGHSMVESKSRIEVKNGEARQITEYDCTNSECGNQKVIDSPYEF